MNLLLLNPPVHHYAGVHYRLNPALGLPTLAATLQQAGHAPQVWDLEAMHVTPGQLAALFEAQPGHWPDAIGLTYTAHSQRGARETVRALRRIGYDRYIAVGGPQATVDPQGPLSWGVNAVVTGEADGNVVDLFETQPTGIIAGQPLPIEQIPGPLWAVHKPAPTYYTGNPPHLDKPESIAMWSRGCPHNCTFCANPVYGQTKVRRRPVQAVYDDMAALKALGVKCVFVYDDELPGMPGGDEWLMDVCRAIQPLGMTWKCQGRCTTKLTRDVLQAMHDAGCRAVMWGVESFSESVLKAMRKGTNEADIWHTLRLAHECGIGNWLFLMVGNYGETPRDLAYTEQQLSKACAEGLVQWRQVTVTTPMPGTELYERAKAEGWLHESPEAGPQMHQVYQSTPWLKERDLRYWHARLEAVG